jgi:hypothetical protein
VSGEYDAIEQLERLDLALGAGDQNAFETIISELADTRQIDLAVDICVADLEWKWRGATSHPDSKSPDPPHDDSVAFYADRLKSFGFNLDLRHYNALVRGLWFCESAWGDRPTISEYQHRYDIDPDVADRMINDLDEIQRWVVKSSTGRGHLRSTPIRASSFELGRQRRDEFDPVYFDEQSKRVVLFPSNASWISREQLQFRRVAIHKVMLKNLGKSTCKFDSELRLPPGDEFERCLPLTFTIADAQIVIETEVT